jgi:hypothetical protein
VSHTHLSRPSRPPFTHAYAGLLTLGLPPDACSPSNFHHEKEPAIEMRRPLYRQSESETAPDPAGSAGKWPAKRQDMRGDPGSVARWAANPISAPRCLGSATIMRNVSAAAVNRMLYTTAFASHSARADPWHSEHCRWFRNCRRCSGQQPLLCPTAQCRQAAGLDCANDTVRAQMACTGLTVNGTVAAQHIATSSVRWACES